VKILERYLMQKAVSVSGVLQKPPHTTSRERYRAGTAQHLGQLFVLSQPGSAAPRACQDV